MAMQGVDLARIHDLEERKNAERLYLAMLTAERTRDEAFEAVLEAALAKDEALRKLNTDYDAACDAYWDDTGPEVMTDENDEIERCALSGLPLLADDEVLEDAETGEKVLRLLLLPPRPEATDEDDGAA